MNRYRAEEDRADWRFVVRLLLLVSSVFVIVLLSSGVSDSLRP